MFVAADQIFCHLVGDFVAQSDWMASRKTQSSWPCLIHALAYTICFIPLTCIWSDIDWSPVSWTPSSISWKALSFIAVTHFIVDRWRLARYVCWLKNFLAPPWIERLYEDGHPKAGEIKDRIRNFPWSECSSTGYDAGKPPFMAIWLMIIADNVVHVLCNGIALKYIGHS